MGGITVERVEVKDVRLPVSLQRAMAAEAEAAREAKAKIIAAEGEMNASKNLKEAADTIASGATIALLADVDGNLGREELNNRIPHSNGFEPAQRQEGLITFAPSNYKMNKTKH